MKNIYFISDAHFEHTNIYVHIHNKELDDTFYK